MAKNSHIQITQRLLDNFSHTIIDNFKGHPTPLDYVFFLDLNDFRIGVERVRLFGAECGFYSDESEDLLSKDVEGPFGNTISTLCNKRTILNEYTFNQDDIDALSNFAYYSFCRSKTVFDKTKSTRPNKGTEVENDEIINAINKKENIFSNHKMVVFDNKTQVEFVIPFNCVTPIIYGGRTLFVLFISPKIAVGLYLKKYDSSTIDIEYKEIKDYHFVDSINFASYNTETRNRKYIIAQTKETLIRILQLMHKPVLEKESEA